MFFSGEPSLGEGDLLVGVVDVELLQEQAIVEETVVHLG